ncbi:MAG: 3,4-dihydroxy-2-butanone-4-phosphate synthase [Kiloniellales bacterium]|nr:3,4-dihydroxy-2-butanone-4-phosphate synthase [Kiloniellales bacterium]
MNNVRSSVEEAVAAVASGEMVVVVDDDDRENEGDLIMAASLATPEQVAFMIRHTSGILCTPITLEFARRLRLDPMVTMNDAPLGTAFTVSVDYRYGLTTGISAEERCNTVRALANANAGAEDFVRPGHIFPLIAREGGVLIRSGHTEAGVDLARMAKQPPVGLLAELVNDDGSVKRGREVSEFAQEHGLKIISVADLIAYRQRREQLVRRVNEFSVVTSAGTARGLAFATPFDPVQHLALVFGNVRDAKGVPTRLHRESILGDVFGDKAGISAAMAEFKSEGRGVLVYLREGSAGVPSSGLQDSGPEAAGEGAASEAVRAELWREVGLGAQILRDLGVSSIKLLASRERQYVGLAGFGIEIEETKII